MPSPTGYWSREEAETNHCFSEALAKWIVDNIQPFDVIDFGAGNGAYCKYLNEHNFYCLAIEGDLNTCLYENKIQQDLSQPFITASHDLGICLEVGEHIPEDYESVFLDNITQSSKYVLLSWAIPNQDGYGHVNCKDNLYIFQQMQQRGFSLQLNQTMDLRSVIEDSFEYLRHTLMLFKR